MLLVCPFYQRDVSFGLLSCDWLFAQAPLGTLRWIGRPGGDLLSRALRHSTMGAGGFHGRVRDGIGCGLPAMATRSSNPPSGQTPVAARINLGLPLGLSRRWRFWCDLCAMPSPGGRMSHKHRLCLGMISMHGACPGLNPGIRYRADRAIRTS
jgi:hypothetical protein